jgi:nitrogen fixation NifU-like protein
MLIDKEKHSVNTAVEEPLKREARAGVVHPKGGSGSPPDGRGKEASDCGDSIEFFIQLNGDTVSDVKCRISGCTNTFVGARAAGTIVKGKTVQEAIKAATSENIDHLAMLPKESKHCAEMASEAVRAALKDAAVTSREPWRKLYKKI